VTEVEFPADWPYEKEATDKKEMIRKAARSDFEYEANMIPPSQKV
jgi:hypothetical protein